MGTCFRLRTAGLALALAAGAALAATGTASAAVPADLMSAPTGISSRQIPDQVAAYWTPERMAKATPEIPRSNGTSTATAQPSRLGAQSADGALPRGGKAGIAGGTTDSTVLGGRATLWSPHGVMPARTIGKLYFTRDDGGSGYCSASVINADNFSSIWTAGHCVHGGGAGRGWFSNFFFRADYDNGSFLAAWSWKYAASTNGWINNGDFGYDIGAVALWPNSLGRVADVTGYQGYKFNTGVYNWTVTSFGYPQDAYPARTDMTGERLFACTNTTTWKVNDNQMGQQCDMFHGASGGPLLQDLQLSRGWGYIVSQNSWHFFAVDEWRQPYLGDGAVNVRNLIKVQ
ncbi:hypothetical protein Val02_29660 [Virgisporangium aliadipatigenens]|uniref:Peptidase n=1 Tax=Virgisporangium aliadipatigenens TaxID=741659 RepID=A0A8J3YLH1_9ACTN|nr:hypothetical protein [Virgisporangium aliadipatigenens]GIJ46080.1 hypothetical protein Val02_29660 [Virgisporangium aliadipatigenens]